MRFVQNDSTKEFEDDVVNEATIKPLLPSDARKMLGCFKVLMMSLAAIVFGTLAYQQLPVSLMPPLAYPSLTVLTVYSGAAPEEVEMEITTPLEERLSTLEGLTSIRSRSLPNQSEITLSLRWDTDIDQTLQRVIVAS